jgi:WhiB family transcriptional regulator, redox-sensing transcriptional regulator
VLLFERGGQRTEKGVGFMWRIRYDWQERAACREANPDLFFPERGSPGDSAKRVCVTCDVRLECLEYALANCERYGVWGGLTERERTRLRRQATSLFAAVREGEDIRDVLERVAVVRIGRRHARAAS